MSSDAEAIFESFVANEPEPERALDALCDRHSEHRDALRKLWAGYCRMSRLLDGVGAGARGERPPDEAHRSRYEVRAEIARGGMGRVLEVWDRDLRRTLAMKVLLDEPADEGLARLRWTRQHSRLVNEAQILGQLEHPGIVPIHEVGLDDEGRPYFTMLRVRGRALGEIFEDAREERGGWTVTRAVGILLRVCEAVAHAHAKGVLHRDLKPANVMVGPFGEVFVMDWGLAKARGHDGAADIRLRLNSIDHRERESARDAQLSPSVRTDRRDALEIGDESPLLTMDGDVLGTPWFMAPEQAAGHVDEVDERSDVYSVGAMLYNLLTGHAPYLDVRVSSTPQQVLRSVVDGAPEAIETVVPRAPQELVAVCRKAMSRKRSERYPTMSDMAEDLRAYLEGRVVRAHRTGRLVALRKWIQRHRIVVGLLVVLFAVLLASTLGFGLLYRETSRQRDQARRMVAFLSQNPVGYRIDYAGIPSLESFVEDFSDGRLDRPLRIWSRPQDIVEQPGSLLMRHAAGSTESALIGLDESLALVRGDFELVAILDIDKLPRPEVGTRLVNLNLVRARDGVSVGQAVHRASAANPVAGVEAFEGYAPSGSVEVGVPWSGPRVGLRVYRTGARIGIDGWFGEWRRLLELTETKEPLQFFLGVHALYGDRGEFQVALDELRFVSLGGPQASAVDPIHETFDEGLGDYLVATGDGGVAGALDGRLVLEKFPGSLGRVLVGLDRQQYVLRSDFDVVLDFEVVEPLTDTAFLFEISAGMVEGSGPWWWCGSVDGRFQVRAGSPVDGVSGPTDELEGGKGKLRIARVGARVSLQYEHDGEWREALTTTDSSEDLRLVLRLDCPEGARRPSGVVAVDDLWIEGVHALW